MKSIILDSLYEEYNIKNLGYGEITDKLGDVYEDFLCAIFKDIHTVIALRKQGGLEKDIIEKFLIKSELNVKDILGISSTKDVPRRPSGGNSKTDVILNFQMADGEIKSFPISVKQTSAPRVAFAEFDVSTICREVGITDERVKSLMLKHQKDASAKYFTDQEKEELRIRLEPFAEKLLRWTITMSPIENPRGNAYPKWILKFKVTKDAKLLNWDFYNIEEYIDCIRLDKKGRPRRGGFGTGLSWTYATGSKGSKIQFKG